MRPEAAAPMHSSETIQNIIERDEVQKTIDLAVRLHSPPDLGPRERTALIAAANSRCQRALVTYDGTPSLLVFIREVARRALENRRS
jgi:hypothetical protein